MPTQKNNNLTDSHILQQAYGLVWEQAGIDETVVNDCTTKTPIIKAVKKLCINSHSAHTEHLLIEGDNYHSLSVLATTHQQQIDLIYIDPPYNTGRKNDFLYNDSYVDDNDSYKHSKWLAFMNRRLQIAAQLLKQTGAIFISIDDNEVAQLRLLCNKIFGEHNFVAQMIRKNKTGSGHDSAQIAIEFDYLLCYAKHKPSLVFAKETLQVQSDTKYKLADAHEPHRGKYYLRDLDYKGSYSPSLDYALTVPDGSIILSGNVSGKPNTWRWSKAKVAWGIANDFVVFKQTKGIWKAYIKQYQYVDNENKRRVRQLPYRAILEYLNAQGSKELNEIVPQNLFRFPKPMGLVQFCINLFKQKNIMVLDFFAGSGTTGHAVLKANKEDAGNRQFILCTNNENDICTSITYPRLAKAIKGYTNDNNKVIPALGGNLAYYKTGFLK